MNPDIDQLTKRVTDLENESFGTDPAIHPVTQQNLKYQVGLLTPTKVAGRSHNPATVSHTSNSAHKLDFATNDFASGITWDSTNHRFTATTAGYYFAVCQATYPAPSVATNYFSAYISKNGSVVSQSQFQIPVGSGNVSVSVSDVVQLNVNDYIEFLSLQDTGGNINVNTGTALTYGSLLSS